MMPASRLLDSPSNGLSVSPRLSMRFGIILRTDGGGNCSGESLGGARRLRASCSIIVSTSSRRGSSLRFTCMGPPAPSSNGSSFSDACSTSPSSFVASAISEFSALTFSSSSFCSVFASFRSFSSNFPRPPATSSLS